MESHLFPVAEELGDDNLKRTASLHSERERLDLCPAYLKAEFACERDIDPDNYHVLFYGNHIGITTIE